MVFAIASAIAGDHNNLFVMYSCRVPYTRKVLCILGAKKKKVKVHDINAGRRDSFGLLQSVLMNVIGLYVACKFGGNVKLLMYDEL